jgi:hypothetical protein
MNIIQDEKLIKIRSSSNSKSTTKLKDKKSKIIKYKIKNKKIITKNCNKIY